MILHTGLRTDIPAFYSEWFVNRLKEGYVLVRNPYNPTQITKYVISPEVVDVISFCTKNPGPFLPHMELIRDYGQYWYVTITPYGRDIEPNVPAKEKVMEDFIRLSKVVGVNCVGWRYDPIFLSDTYTLERHISDFETMAETLAGYTKVCVISFIDLYKKVLRNFPEVRAVSKEDRLTIGKEFVQIGKKYDITIKTCAEGDELAPYGADCSGCMTIPTFEKAIGCALKPPKQSKGRKECTCYLGADIGAYNTCGHLCKYCYANYDAETVKRNMQTHNPRSPILLGEVAESDVVCVAKQASWKDMQLSLFT